MTSPSVIPTAPTVYLSPHKSVALSVHPTDSPSDIPTATTVCLSPRKSVALSVHPTDSPSVIPTAPTVCLSPRKSVALSVHPTDSPSVIPARPSHEPSVHPPVTPSMTRPSATPPVSLAPHQSDRPSPSDRLYTILPRLSGCPTSHHLYDTSPSDHPSPSQGLYDTHTPIRQTIHHRHVTHGKCDFGGATLNNPSLGCSYVLPRLWDPGGVSSSANTPRDLSRTIAPSRYPYALLMG